MRFVVLMHNHDLLPVGGRPDDGAEFDARGQVLQHLVLSFQKIAVLGRIGNFQDKRIACFGDHMKILIAFAGQRFAGGDLQSKMLANDPGSLFGRKSR